MHSYNLPIGRRDIRYTCPICNMTFFFKGTNSPDLWQERKEILATHLQKHSKNSIQRDLYGGDIHYGIEVITDMKIPTAVTEGGSKTGLPFVKASQLPGAKPGMTMDVSIDGEVEVSGGANPLYSVPVRYSFNGTQNRAQYSLNKSTLKALVRVLGDETDSWRNARFQVFIGPTRNPQTNEQTLGFTVLTDTVKKGTAKPN